MTNNSSRKIPVSEPSLGKKELEYLEECIRTGWISSKGRFVQEFEKEFSKFCGVKYGISTTNGTAALHLSLASLGVGHKDEVILPTFTMISVANAVAYTGARPVFVDSDKQTWNIDPGKIEDKITEKTKAIIAVHTYGHPADMRPIIDIANDHDLYVIEDAAEAHGAKYKGNRTGSLGDVASFSFYANKIITTGEGGMVVTNNEEIAERSRLLKDLAFVDEKRFWHTEIGFNYRLTNLQAAIGLAQLERVKGLIKVRRKVARMYNSLLEGANGVTLPPEASWAKNVYWMYSILIEDEFNQSRDEVISKLKESGIETRSFFIPMHHQPIFSDNSEYPVADDLSKKGINLPTGSYLNNEDITYIVEKILEN